MMKAKEFLRQLKDVNHLIDAYDEEYRRLMTKATSTSQRLSAVPIHSGDNLSKQEAICMELMELAEKADRSKKNMADIERKALEVIEQIKPLKFRTVLIKYYIQNKTLEETAVEMNLTYRWVCKLHGQALNAFDEVVGKNIKKIC